MIDLQTRISPNFRLGEFFVTTQRGGQAGLVADLTVLDKDERDRILINLRRLASQLEAARRELADRPITIISGWRSWRVNKAVGGAAKSFHLLGMAADFTVEGLTPAQVQQRLDPYWPGGMEYAPTWTHLDIRPKRERFKP